ncbi:MAG: hypothetical protein KC505_02020 [Myxococcales bacterium]|nr:hypothetical protein [Myxococcales bacterium]USN50790.1 MAG: hypothetical protein H6731_11130 [Myxococcales bacterium]
MKLFGLLAGILIALINIEGRAAEIIELSESKIDAQCMSDSDFQSLIVNINEIRNLILQSKFIENPENRENYRKERYEEVYKLLKSSPQKYGKFSLEQITDLFFNNSFFFNLLIEVVDFETLKIIKICVLINHKHRSCYDLNEFESDLRLIAQRAFDMEMESAEKKSFIEEIFNYCLRNKNNKAKGYSGKKIEKMYLKIIEENIRKRKPDDVRAPLAPLNKQFKIQEKIEWD